MTKKNPDSQDQGPWYTMAKYPEGVIICPLCGLPESKGKYENECHCWPTPPEMEVQE